MDVSAEPSVVYIVHIIALNEQLIAGNDGDISVDKYLSDFDVDQEKKNLFFKNAGEVRSVNCRDIYIMIFRRRLTGCRSALIQRTLRVSFSLSI